MLTIITPCSRPENLEKLLESMIMIPSKGLRWIIVYDADSIPNYILRASWIEHYAVKGGVSGNLQRNLALSKITDGWVYCLDDDNLMHPDFWHIYFDILADHGIKGLILEQELPDGTIRKNTPETVKCCHIDQAQFVLHRSILDREYVQQYEADGILIEDIYKRHADKFAFVPGVKSYYNKLSNGR